MVKLNKTLVSGSLILLITFNIFNILNFVFQFSMARMLTIAQYGTLAALFSIIYIFDIFKESIQTIIVKYSSKESKLGKLNNIFKRSLKKALLISIVVFIIYLILSIPLSGIIKINYSLLALTGLALFLTLTLPIGRGIMLGRKMFKQLGLNMVVESTFKLALAILFVVIGWAVYGAIAATLIGASIALLFSFFSLREIRNTKEIKAKTQGIYKYSIPVFFIMIIIILFYSLDVIIAKMVFSPETAGYYALASILGKTIFWGTQPISRAMFPLSAEKSKKKEGHILFNALGMLLAMIAVALTLFYFFPEFILKIFSGKENIQEASKVLLYTGIAFGLQSLTNLVLLYKLSLGEVKGYLYFIAFIIIEIALLFYLSSSLIQFSLAYMVASAIFLIGSIIILRK